MAGPIPPPLQLVEDTLRFASHGFVTADDDDPAVEPIAPRAGPGFTISRHLQIDGDGTFGGMIDTTVSDIELENTDRGLDVLALTHQLAGRPVTVQIAAGAVSPVTGRVEVPPLSQFGLMFKGRIRSTSYANSEERSVLRATLESDEARLDRPLQSVFYSGAGGLDGTPELAGVSKPWGFGRVLSAEPALLDPVKNIRQFSQGGSLEVTAVKDEGVDLEFRADYPDYASLEALIPEGGPDQEETPGLLIGQYATCLRQSCFRMGAPAAGKVTVEFRGRGDYIASKRGRAQPYSDGTFFKEDGTGWVGGGNVAYAGGVRAIVAMLLSEFSGIPNGEVNRAAIVYGDGSPDPTAGIYLPPGGSATVRDTIKQFCKSHLAFVGRDRWGQWGLWRLKPPGPIGVVTIDQSNVVDGSVEVRDLPYGQPWPTWRIEWNRRFAVLNDNEIAEAAKANGGLRNFLTTPVNTIERQDPILAKLNPERGAITVPSLLGRVDQASAFLEEAAALYSRGRVAMALSAKGIWGKVAVGSTVTVRLPQHNLAAGRNFVAVAVGEGSSGRVTGLGLFG